MRPFSYQRATAPDEALAAQGRFIAGGTNLLDLMKHQVETPDRLVHDVWEFADAHATMRPQS